MRELWESMERLEKVSKSAARHHLLSRICVYMLENEDTITAQEIQKIVDEIEEEENNARKES